jgi:hypothetical protein
MIFRKWTEILSGHLTEANAGRFGRNKMLSGVQTIWAAYWVQIYTLRLVVGIKMIVLLLLLMMILALLLVTHTHKICMYTCVYEF